MGEPGSVPSKVTVCSATSSFTHTTVAPAGIRTASVGNLYCAIFATTAPSGTTSFGLTLPWNQGLKLVVPEGAVVAKIAQYKFRSEEHTSELQSRPHIVCPLLLEKKTTVTKSSAAPRATFRAKLAERALPPSGRSLEEHDLPLPVIRPTYSLRVAERATRHLCSSA